MNPKLKQRLEYSDTFPKFQQAFGKSAYQNNVDSPECSNTNSNSINTNTDKSSGIVKSLPKNSNTSLNVQPVQGGVIYARQIPITQTINLIPPGRGQVFRIATSNKEQLSLVKDSVIQGKMSALLAAALHSKQHNSDDHSNNSDENSTAKRVAITTRPTIVQNCIVKPVIQIPSNVIRSTTQSNLSSTTLEQLREFDMVYKQVKERSSISTPPESNQQTDCNESHHISVTYLNQGQKLNCTPVVVVSSYCNAQPAASPSLSVTSQGSSSPCVTPAPTITLSKSTTKSSKSKSFKSITSHSSKPSPIPKPQQKPQEDEHTTQRIFDILAEYAEQLRNSPDLNNKPAPRRRSNPPTNPNSSSKRKKNSGSKRIVLCNNVASPEVDLDDTHTIGSEDSSSGVVQISVKEEEQPSTTTSSSEVSESAGSPKQLILAESGTSQSRSVIISDSNNSGEGLKMPSTAVLVPGNYIMPVSMVKGGQQIAVVSGGSKILATVPARSGPNMLLFQSFINQTRKQQTVPTVKYSTLHPVSTITRNVTSVITQAPSNTSPTSKNMTVTETTTTSNVNHLERSDTVDAELLLTISQPLESKNTTTQKKTNKLLSSTPEILQNVSIVEETATNTKNISENKQNCDEKPIIATAVATSVIARSGSAKETFSERHSTTTKTVLNLNLPASNKDKDTAVKVEGRVQSVLVSTGTPNGPMLSHNPPTCIRQADSTNSISESNRDEYLHKEGKQTNTERKPLQGTRCIYQGKVRKVPVGSRRLNRELQQLTLQRKQAVLERELKLQKSLSEECEDLGVDEPSTSELFPEADLLFESNHSPAFDQVSHDPKRNTHIRIVKEETTKAVGLFCDDEPMRNDLLFEPIEYPSTVIELECHESTEMTNGQINESGISCEDNTLLQTSTSMSDVTIPSPISPNVYISHSPPPINRCKYKYSNRKKLEGVKQIENWAVELSTSEDTGNTEVTKICHSPEIFTKHKEHCNEELYTLSIVEHFPLKEEDRCEMLHCGDVINCPNGRSARQSLKKLCSCSNGSSRIIRKRSTSRPSTPFSNKKTVIAKKR